MKAGETQSSSRRGNVLSRRSILLAGSTVAAASVRRPAGRLTSLGRNRSPPRRGGVPTFSSFLATISAKRISAPTRSV